MKAPIWLLAIGMCVMEQAFAQEIARVPDLLGQDSTGRGRINILGVNLERELNTFNWTGFARIDTVSMGTIVRMAGQYTSNTILLDGSSSSGGQLRSDQENLSFLLGRPLAKALTSEVQWSSVVYSDNKSVGLGHSAFHSVLGGVEYAPFDDIVVSPFVGYRWDSQSGVKDKGLSYTLGMRTDSLNMDGYELGANAQFHEDRLDPRLLQRHVARMGAQKYFSDNTRDSLDLGYSRNRSEFYDVADGDIESRTEDILSFANLLDYEIDPHVTTSLFVKVTDRSLGRKIRHYSALPAGTPRFNTAIDEFRLETYYQLTYKALDGGLMASARLGHDERNEQHSAQDIADEQQFNTQNREEKTKDNLTRQTSLTGMVRLPLSSSDTLLVSGATSILRYDTPADLPEDARVDRDELLIALSVATTHHINRYLDLGLTINGNLNHIVYLFSRWSGNNSYNRVLRLSPAMTYRPTRAVASTNVFEVLANYTVYDFEDLVPDYVHSYSYRQFSWMDSSSVDFATRMGLDFYSHLKLYERGQLKWSDFSERLENSFVDKTISSQLRFRPGEDLLFALGIRYFSQKRYAYVQGVKAVDLSIKSIGPTCMIVWDVGLHSRVVLQGWYERRTSSGSTGQTVELARSLPNLTMNIAINL